MQRANIDEQTKILSPVAETLDRCFNDGMEKMALLCLTELEKAKEKGLTVDTVIKTIDQAYTALQEKRMNVIKDNLGIAGITD